MTSGKLLILGIAAFVAVGAGLWLAGRQGSSGDAAHATLYPQLKQQLDEITTVKLFEADDVPAVELQRQGTDADSDWRVGEREGYAADAAKLRTLLRSIAEARIFEEKTANPQQYASLGVQDRSAPDASVQGRDVQTMEPRDQNTTDAGGVRIELWDRAQENKIENQTGKPTGDQAVGPVVNLIVGKRGAGVSTYVRRAGEPQSWLIDTVIDTSASPADWLRKDLLDISADRIQAATITVNEQSTWTASKPSRAAADFTVEGLPRGKKLDSSSAANGVATALVGLTLTDVQPAATFQGAAADARARFTTFDGLLVHLEGWRREDRHFIAVTADVDPAQAERFKLQAEPAQPSADQGPDPTSNQARSTGQAPDQTSGPVTDRSSAPVGATDHQPSNDPAIDEVLAGSTGATGETAASGGADASGSMAAVPALASDTEAKELRSRLSGWIFEIPGYQYDGIFKPVDDLLAP